MTQIVASTFDNFTQYLTPEIVANLPVYDEEIGDTWIYVRSDGFSIFVKA